jgi:long-chain acyl-CoA synthetase
MMPLMHISEWAKKTPDGVAVRMAGSGDTVTFAELERAANQSAQLLRRLGLKRGDAFAIWSTNNPRFLECALAMQRSGLYMVPIASKLTAPEAAYIINDSHSRVLLIDAGLGAAALDMAAHLGELCPTIETVRAMRGDLPNLTRWEAATAEMPATLIDDPSTGLTLIYSSGTTGKPKGVRRPLPEAPFDTPDSYLPYHQQLFRTEPGTHFIATAPLYHSGPLAFVLSELHLGASVLIFEKFDAEKVLAAIDRYRPLRGQFVPTMFTRMLKLPGTVRARYDVSSIKVAMHSAAPCPVTVKKAMIEWWGPVLYEIYGGTVTNG